MRQLPALVIALSFAAVPAARAAETLPPSAIGSGKARWIGVSPNEPLLNAEVDLGTLRRVGDTLEFSSKWVLGPGILNDLRLKYSNLKIPENTYSANVERVICGSKGETNFLVSGKLVAPDGKLLHESKENPVENRKKAETSSWGPAPYGTDIYSLVCLAAARKCAGKDFTWPGPKDLTPLEHSAKADKMRAEYNARFLSSCKFKK